MDRRYRYPIARNAAPPLRYASEYAAQYPRTYSGNVPFQPLEGKTSTQYDTSVPATANLYQQRRKLSSVIITFKNESAASPTANVECNSETKPIYFKAVLNKLVSEKSPGSPEISPSGGRKPATILRKEPLRKNIECHSQSNVLNVRDTRRRSEKRVRWPEPRHPESADLMMAGSYDSSMWDRGYYGMPAASNVGYQNFVPNYFFVPYLPTDLPTAVPAASPTTITPIEDSEDPTTEPDPAQSTVSELVIAVSNKTGRAPGRDNTPPLTRIILRPVAHAVAGKSGIAISSPISTAYVKRGDYVEIEYLPEANATVGEGGIAFAKPELVIHFVDRRRK